jgi:predicted RNA methylase
MKEAPHDTREAERREAQWALDRQQVPAERNRLGQFPTPPGLAFEMAALGERHLPPRSGVRLLDPGVGTGVFFYAAKKALGTRRVRSALGFEIDPEVAALAERLWAPLGLRVRREDFCAATPPDSVEEKATFVLCNPPYVRHHHLSAEQKAFLRNTTQALGLRVSGLAGLYCYFLLLAHKWMAPSAVAVWIIPAEFLDVNYGRAIKMYLTRRVTLLDIHRFDPEDIQFADALVTSAVVAFRNEPPAPGHRTQLATGGSLLAPHQIRQVTVEDLDPEAKWGPLFAGPGAGDAGAEGGGLTIGDLFFVKRGLATGANDFFILDRAQARSLGLPVAFLRPILPGPRFIPGNRIDRAENGFPKGIPEQVLVDCDLPPEEVVRRAPALAAYLEEGRREGIPERYLPAHRRLWYNQEVRPPAPILCTYMGRQNGGGRALRFIRNRSAATAPNVYLLLYPRPAFQDVLRADPDALDRVFEALTEAAGRLANGGRVYGGGLNKIEPKESAAVELPAWVRQVYGALLAGHRQRDLPGMDSRIEGAER